HGASRGEAMGARTITADTLATDTGTDTAIGTAGLSTQLVTRTAGRAINVGGADIIGTQLGLSDDELDHVTASVLSIGDANSGPITVSANINPAGSNSLNLISAADIMRSGAFIMTSTTLAVTSGSGDIGASALPR